MKKILRPSFTSKFHCLGQDCKYTCCAKWKISMGEEEANRIQKGVLDKGEFFPEFDDTYILPMEENEGKKQFQLGFSEQGTCQFLSPEQLCSLQIHCGSKTIPQVCKVFPRGYTYYLDQLELYLSPACERVIELLIEEKQSIRLVSTKEKFLEDTLIKAYTKLDLIKNPMLNYYYDIKTLGLSLLQNPRFTMEQRLMTLGIPMKELDRLSQSGQMNEVQKYINTFMDHVNTEEYAATIKSLAGNKQMKVMNALILLNTLSVDWLQDILNQVNVNIGVTNTAVNEKERRFQYDINLYQYRKKQVTKFFEDRPYALENIIVNWYLYGLQPFSDKSLGVWDNYLAFSVMISLYLFVITCLAEPDWKEEEFINHTVVLSRVFVHSGSLIKGLLEYYNGTHTGSLADLAIILLD